MICNPPQARTQHHEFGDMKSLRLRIANPQERLTDHNA